MFTGPIRNFFRRFKPGSPVCKVVNLDNLDKVYNILEDLDGIGCTISKPTDANGKGWMIVVEAGGAQGNYPWKVSVGEMAGSYKISMTNGIAIDIISGYLASFVFAPVAADTGYVYLSFPAQGNGITSASVGFASSLPSSSNGNIIYPIAYVSGSGSNWTVLQYQVGQLPVASLAAETV